MRMKILILGGDGYLGWPTAMHLANRGHDVSVADSYIKREIAEKFGCKSLIENPRLPERTDTFKAFSGKRINHFVGDVTDCENLGILVEAIKPHVIIHYGEFPSAPYSMLGYEQARETMNNNLNSTLSLIHAVIDHCPNAHIIKLGCYDDETEILTKRGWVLFDDLTDKDEVATRSANDRKMTFKKPKKIHAFEHKGEMILAESQRVNFCVTPNHRCFTVKRSNSSYYGLNEILAENLVNEQNYKHYDIGMSPTLSGAIGDRLFLELLGWHLAEGYANKTKKRIEIKQKKGEKEKWIRSILQDLELDFVEYEEKEWGGIRFSIKDKWIFDAFAPFGKSRDKYVPRWVFELGSDDLKYILDALIAGDGWVHHRGHRYFSISEQLADDVQELALRCGFSGIKTERNDGYQISIMPTTFPRVKPKDVKSIDYDGMVHCVEIGDGEGIVLVRRNGRPVWSGNTMGEYGTPNVPIKEGWLYHIEDGRHQRFLYPATPGSLYHVTKVQDTHLLWLYARTHGLRVTDIMQGPVYGLDTEETVLDPDLATSFHYDDLFGTVVNRFLVQAVAGHPLTVYGKGGQTRGFIHLQDVMRSIEIVAKDPPLAGEFRIINQLTSTDTIMTIAGGVALAAKKLGIDAVVENIPNPRVEREEHFYEVEADYLSDHGLDPIPMTTEILSDMLRTVQRYRDRINTAQMLPRHAWRRSETFTAAKEEDENVRNQM